MKNTRDQFRKIEYHTESKVEYRISLPRHSLLSDVIQFYGTRVNVIFRYARKKRMACPAPVLTELTNVRQQYMRICHMSCTKIRK